MDIYNCKHTVQGIPIVPMLDILTILLIFFIVHTEFKHQINVLKLDLPRTRHLSGETADNHHILLEVGADGSLALGGRSLTSGELAPALQELVRENPQATVQISAAESSSMGRFMEVMDTLTAAGIQIEEVPVQIHYQP